MKYDHMVNMNGVYYMAGEEVPEKGHRKNPEKKLTKTDINRMNVAKLRKTASKMGFKNVEKTSGIELKNQLISSLEL